GSIPYMAPERASGAKDIGPACDIYALRVILYELLAGTLPLMAESIPGLLAAIASQLPESPRRKRPEIPADLEAVCLKCLEKRSKDRYRTAGELAVDLRRFLAGEAVTARLPGRWERLQRWVRRNPTTASVLATLAVAVVVVVGVLVDANQKQSDYIQQLETADRERTSASIQLRTSNAQLTRAVIDAGQARRQAETQRRKMQENFYVSEFQQALQAWEKQDLPVMERTLDRLDQPEFAPFRGIEYDWLRTKLYRPRRELMTFPRAVYTLAFSGDGEILAAAGRDAIVKLVRFADGSPVGEWETGQKEVNGLAFVDGNQKLWTSGDDGSLVLWEISTRKELRRLNAHAPEQAHDLMVIPHLNLLLSMGTDGRVLLWDPLTGESVGELPGNGQRAVATEMHLDGQHLYVAYQNQIGRWMLADRTQVSAFPLRYRPMSFRLSADGHWMFVTNESKNLEVRDSQTGEVVAETHLNDQVRQVIRIPRSASYFAVDDRGTLHEWTPVVGETERSMGIKSRIVASLLDGRTYFAQFTPDFLGIVA
ncbi:MAG TPA: hypothetical protein VL132_05590, partial [Planctomycetaceae bacterium]|nr:hypothetical protein [Planctomycetaceae bacterium]